MHGGGLGSGFGGLKVGFDAKMASEVRSSVPGPQCWLEPYTLKRFSNNSFTSIRNSNLYNLFLMTIEVIQKEVYGNTLTYVADESVRNSIKKLTGRKTLTDYDIEALKELGFVLVLKQMTVNI